jgi:hypothetical protein
MVVGLLRANYTQEANVTAMWQREVRKSVPPALNLFKIFKPLWIHGEAAQELRPSAGKKGAGPVLPGRQSGGEGLPGCLGASE